MIAGKPSHGPLSHEHNAGIQLLAKCLKQGATGLVAPVVTLNGWPSDESIFEGADAVVIYSDGGGGHPAVRGDNLLKLGKLMEKGVGFLTIHYAVEPTTNKGNKEFLDWQGGCFETHWSVNPHWTANFSKLPKHPDHSRRETVQGKRRVVLPHAVCTGHERRDAHSFRCGLGLHDEAWRRSAQWQSALFGRPWRRAKSQHVAWAFTGAKTAVAASDSPVATTTLIGATMTSARRCSTPSSGWPRPRCRRAECSVQDHRG